MSEKHKFGTRGELLYCPYRDRPNIKSSLKLQELVKKKIKNLPEQIKGAPSQS